MPGIFWQVHNLGVPILRNSLLVEAPARTVAAAVREVVPLRRAAATLGARVEADTVSDLLTAGDELRCAMPVLPGLRARMRLRVIEADAGGLVLRLSSGSPQSLELRTTLTETPAGTLVVETLDWASSYGPIGAAADVLRVRSLVLALLAARAAETQARAAQLHRAPTVVATAIVRDGALLVQQRAYPERLAGQWELPGGRVEAGESEAEAVVRECREELGVEVLPGDRLGPDVPLANGYRLRVHAAQLVESAARPQAREHQAVRWIGDTELTDLDWVPADRALLPELRALLQ